MPIGFHFDDIEESYFKNRDIHDINTSHKQTDYKYMEEQIIEALEIRMPHDAVCRGAYEIINRQKVEIESLKIANEKMYSANKVQEAEIERLNKCIKTEDEVREIMESQMLPMVREITVAQIDRAKEIGRIEAIKEFAERLKANMSNIARMEYGGNIYFCVGYDLIDNLVKEMTEDLK